MITQSIYTLQLNSGARTLSSMVPTISLSGAGTKTLPTGYTVVRAVSSAVTSGSPTKFKNLLSPVKSIVPNTTNSFTVLSNETGTSTANHTKIMLHSSPSKYYITPQHHTVCVHSQCVVYWIFIVILKLLMKYLCRHVLVSTGNIEFILISATK